MAAFEDFCIVCDKQCAPNSVYCSEECRHRDEEQTYSPTLSVCSSLNHCYKASSSGGAGTANNSISVVSPLLTPQFIASSKAGGSGAMAQIEGLSYESPMLAAAGKSVAAVCDLDSNRLDLNVTAEAGIMQPRTGHELTPSNVSDLLDKAEQNYKKWLSTH